MSTPTNESERERLLAKLRQQLENGRTAGREKYAGGVFFWSVAQTRTREKFVK